MHRNKTDHVPSSGIDKYDALKKQFASADPDGEGGDLGSILLAEQVKGKQRKGSKKQLAKDGTMTSDNETANEDEDGDNDLLDIPMRSNKISSRYSSKRTKQFGLLTCVDQNESGYSTTSMGAGANRNHNESDDDARSFSTHGLYTGQKNPRSQRKRVTQVTKATRNDESNSPDRRVKAYEPPFDDE